MDTGYTDHNIKNHEKDLLEKKDASLKLKRCRPLW
jgi:hypothetical protein